MSEINISLEGGASKRLLTAGKYCDRDIIVTAEAGKLPTDLLALRLNNTLKEYNSEEVVYVGNYAFWSVNSLESISLPNCKEVTTACFQNCKSLKAASFRSCTAAGGTVFRGCSSLLDVNFPSLEYTSTYIFAECSALERIVLPKVKQLGGAAFHTCASLQFVDLPSVTSVGAMAFQNCSLLTTVIIRQDKTVCTLAATTAFTGTPIADGTGFIYVPSSMLSTFKSASNWSAYADQIRAIEDYPEICGVAE